MIEDFFDLSESDQLRTGARSMFLAEASYVEGIPKALRFTVERVFAHQEK